VSEACQLDLLSMPVDPLPARTSDPETSRAAARELPLRARQQECVDALRWLCVSATADDVKRCLAEHGMVRERNECASRLSELERLGRVRKVGVRKNHRGKNVATWRLVS
jgi:hypothetical protein